ncbi:MAG: heparinase II/III family protein [Alphaproteobacteria bacterium]|nr:heparinase II/III family protein [Alphaproteobacteria bacterium]
MSAQIFKTIQKAASTMAYNSFVYNWSLKGAVADHLLVKPVDPWPGDAEAARALCGGAFTIDHDVLDPHGHWEPAVASPIWISHMHGFTWLRDLRALGGDHARKVARSMIESWALNYKTWSETAWAPGVTGERAAMWIALFEFFGVSADDDFQDLYFESLTKQARHLSRILPGDAYGLELLKGVKGLLYAGLAFEGYEAWAEQALDILKDEIKVQILGDGAHISRSPAQLLDALMILLDIRSALNSAAYPCPESLQHAIDKMGPALRFFRYSDKHFALFNGAQEAPVKGEDLVDCVLGQANVRGKGLQSLPCAGYERVSMGRTVLLFDGGKAPPYPHEREAHAAPLAFELCHGKERIFVSCGTHPTSEDWRDSLRSTAAHSAVTLDHRNAYEIGAGGHFMRRTKDIDIIREENKDAALLEGSHDGYVSVNGMTHRRRLFLSDGGHDLRGEDLFTSNIGKPIEALGRPVDVAVRFHIHPRVQVSLVKDDEEALLRLPNGIGWRFSFSAGHLALEDSIYLGQGAHPRKTKQLVIYGQITEDTAKIKWALHREG